MPSFSKLKILPPQIKALQQQVYSCPLDKISSWPKLIFQTGCCCCEPLSHISLASPVAKDEIDQGSTCMYLLCVCSWCLKWNQHSGDFRCTSVCGGAVDTVNCVSVYLALAVAGDQGRWHRPHSTNDRVASCRVVFWETHKHGEFLNVWQSPKCCK